MANARVEKWETNFHSQFPRLCFYNLFAAQVTGNFWVCGCVLLCENCCEIVAALMTIIPSPTQYVGVHFLIVEPRRPSIWTTLLPIWMKIRLRAHKATFSFASCKTPQITLVHIYCSVFVLSGIFTSFAAFVVSYLFECAWCDILLCHDTCSPR